MAVHTHVWHSLCVAQQPPLLRWRVTLGVQLANVVAAAGAALRRTAGGQAQHEKYHSAVRNCSSASDDARRLSRPRRELVRALHLARPGGLNLRQAKGVHHKKTMGRRKKKESNPNETRGPLGTQGMLAGQAKAAGCRPLWCRLATQQLVPAPWVSSRSRRRPPGGRWPALLTSQQGAQHLQSSQPFRCRHWSPRCPAMGRSTVAVRSLVHSRC